MSAAETDAPGSMEGGELEADTAMEKVDGRWIGEIHPRWNVGSNPNGGYTLAMAARAMLAATARPDPLTLTAHYVAPPAMGPVEIRTEIVRAGRRYATVEARLVQGDKELVRVLGAVGDLTAQQGLTRVAGVPPAIPAPEDCIGMLSMSESRGGVVPRVMHRYDLRLDPGCEWVSSRMSGTATNVADTDVAGNAATPAPDAAHDAVSGAGAGTAIGVRAPLPPLEVAGWIRFGDGTEPSVLGLLAFADAFPPTLIGSAKVGWIPTIELTVHVRARPVPGWILGVSRTRFLVDGLLEQDGELWDSAGNLVVLCRQLALVMPPR